MFSLRVVGDFAEAFALVLGIMLVLIWFAVLCLVVGPYCKLEFCGLTW